VKKGDLILIPFPFTNLKGNKIRPALILLTTELDVTVAFITSESKWKDEFDLEVTPNDMNGLKADSIIRLSKLATIEKDLVLGKLGELNRKEMRHMNSNLKALFQL
jgi:mRNA interferase MazF